MKLLFTILLAFSLIFVSCTKNGGRGSDEKSMEKISFDSPFKFVYDPTLATTNFIASFQDQKIEAHQVNRNTSAIEGLILSKEEEAVVLAYQMVEESDAKEGESEKILIQFPFAEPKKGLKTILASRDLEGAAARVDAQFTVENLAPGTIVVAGKTYTEKQLSLMSLPYSKIQDQIFNLRIRAIEDQVSRRVIIAEAKKKNIPLNEYIKDHVKSSQEVTDDDARQYGIENNIPEKEINDEMLQRLKSIVETRQSSNNLMAHSAQLMGNQSVKVAFKKPVYSVNAINLPQSTPQKGSGKVTVTLLSSLMCVECKDIEKQLGALVDKSKDKLKYSYVFHFKEEDRVARMVSEASLCVAKQNKNMFWEFQKACHQEDFDGQETVINEIVKSLNLDFEAFRKCFLSREFKQTIDDQKLATKSFGYLKLPVVLVNGLVFEDPQSFEELEHAIKNQMGSSANSIFSRFWNWIKSFFS